MNTIVLGTIFGLVFGSIDVLVMILLLPAYCSGLVYDLPQMCQKVRQELCSDHYPGRVKGIGRQGTGLVRSY